MVKTIRKRGAGSKKRPVKVASKRSIRKPKPKPAAKKRAKRPAASKRPVARKAAKAKARVTKKSKANVRTRKVVSVKTKSAKRPPSKPKAAAKPAITAKAAAKQAAANPLALRPIPIPVARKHTPLPPLPRPLSPLQRPKVVSRVKLLPMDFMIELAKTIREAVVPAFNSARGREAVGGANSGDVTFGIDKVAERALLTFLKDAKMPVAYYSEDSGYTTFTTGQPLHLLVVDPIDGTRAAKNGFEYCTVSVASTRIIERPAMGDVDSACVMEIATDRTFYAERGKGAKIITNGVAKKPKLHKNSDLETISWSMTVPARPAELIFPTAAKLIDLSSLKGGFFACNSTSYSLTRLLTTQLDACVDFANRYLRDIPDAVQDHFINAGRGATLGIAPYDLAAALLIAQEAGAAVTDAYGNSFDDVLLLDSSPSNHRSLIAASNKDLYEKLWNFFDTRIKQFEQLLARRMTN